MRSLACVDAGRTVLLHEANTFRIELVGEPLSQWLGGMKRRRGGADAKRLISTSGGPVFLLVPQCGVLAKLV